MAQNEEELLKELQTKLQRCHYLVNKAVRRQQSIENEIGKAKIDLSNIKIKKQLNKNDVLTLGV